MRTFQNNVTQAFVSLQHRIKAAVKPDNESKIQIGT